MPATWPDPSVVPQAPLVYHQHRHPRRTRRTSMKRMVLGFFSVVILLALAGSEAFAHHAATATYVHGKSIMIEGTLKEFVWRNPHSFIKVEAPDDKGVTQLWLIE